MKAYILSAVLILGSFILKGQSNDDVNKMILGKWKYNVAYDTIAIASLGNKNNTNNIFLTEIVIKRKKAKLHSTPEKLNATWEIKNTNELYFYFDNSKVLKYLITKITSNSLELREFGLDISTLGYKKK
ncbi:hypothetical protein BH11BAC3_BH11BAC3_23630 [soil metagenome]